MRRQWIVSAESWSNLELTKGTFGHQTFNFKKDVIRTTTQTMAARPARAIMFNILFPLLFVILTKQDK